MKNIIKSFTSQQQKYIHFTFPQQFPQINFGTSKIPKCQFCGAYLSAPFDHHQKSFIKQTLQRKDIDQKIQQCRYECNLCGSLTLFPIYLPIKINQIPQTYKVELLPTQHQFKAVSDRLPTFLLLIDRHYPLIQCLRDALLDILEKLDNQYEFFVCVYDNQFSFFDLKGNDIEEMIIDQECFEAILDTASQNNQKFRQNLSTLFGYLNQNTTQPFQNIQMNKNKSMFSTYNGVLKLKILLGKFSAILQNKNFKQKIYGLRIIWFEYLPSPSFWKIQKHPKITVQCYVFNKNPQMLQYLANSVDNLTVLSQDHCVQQLHFTLYQTLQAIDNLYYFTARAKAKIEYSVELAYPCNQLFKKRSLGLIIRQRSSKTIDREIRNRRQIPDSRIFIIDKPNVYQVSATFYEPLDHKKYLYVSTFSSDNISKSPSITLSRFHEIKRGLQGHMQKIFLTSKSNQTFNKGLKEQEKTPTAIVNQLNWIYKDSVKCADLYKAFKQGDINGTYILFPIIAKRKPYTLIYAFRSSYVISNSKKLWTKQEIEKQAEINDFIEQLNDKAGIYFSRNSSSFKHSICYKNLLSNQQNQLFQMHFLDAIEKNKQTINPQGNQIQAMMQKERRAIFLNDN